MKDRNQDLFQHQIDVEELKEAEKGKLRDLEREPTVAELKKEEKRPTGRSARRRPWPTAWLLIGLGILLLFAAEGGDRIWEMWWLIFLFMPLFWGGWGCGRRAC